MPFLVKKNTCGAQVQKLTPPPVHSYSTSLSGIKKQPLATLLLLLWLTSSSNKPVEHRPLLASSQQWSGRLGHDDQLVVDLVPSLVVV